MAPAAFSLARLRITLTYLWRHRRLPALTRPQRFTELVQWRKLHDRDARMPVLADKVRVKAHVADRIGAEWLIPTLWTGDVLPETPPWPTPFVVKSRHGCNQTRVVRDRADWSAIRVAAARWLRRPYGYWLDEWLYRGIDRGLLVEPFVGVGDDLPVDYKFYVFGGRVAFVQVHLDRARRHRWILLDRDWTRLSGRGDAALPDVPSQLPAMIVAAETLGRGFDFVRVDLYQPADRPLFGEMTFYPGSGLDPFDPPELDLVIGARWRAVRAGWPWENPPIPRHNPRRARWSARQSRCSGTASGSRS
ncbi:MAG: ATP-grasp fold amidoligase family protein [Pseudomonadota bacterium]